MESLQISLIVIFLFYPTLIFHFLCVKFELLKVLKFSKIHIIFQYLLQFLSKESNLGLKYQNIIIA